MVLLDSILEGMVLNLGNIIFQSMFSILGISKRSLPFGSIINRILKHFRVLITEPTFLNTKELEDEAIANLVFV